MAKPTWLAVLETTRAADEAKEAFDQVRREELLFSGGLPDSERTYQAQLSWERANTTAYGAREEWAIDAYPMPPAAQEWTDSPPQKLWRLERDKAWAHIVKTQMAEMAASPPERLPELREAHLQTVWRWMEALETPPQTGKRQPSSGPTPSIRHSADDPGNQD